MKEHLLELQELFSAPEQECAGLWVASLPKPKHILMEHRFQPNQFIFSFEVYRDLEGSPAYARIYGKPVQTHVPTIIIGDIVKLANFSHWDRRPLIPLNGIYDITLDGTALVYPSDIEPLQGMGTILQLPKLAYISRSSTFVLTERRQVDIAGIPASAKIHRNVVHQGMEHEFFAHIFSGIEDAPLTDDIYGFLLTNSFVYINRHAELQFEKI